MIFSTFRGTLHYLRRKLEERGYSLELMYGPTPSRDEDCRRGEKSRERISAEFRQGKFEILLASEVAAKGGLEHATLWSIMICPGIPCGWSNELAGATVSVRPQRRST